MTAMTDTPQPHRNRRFGVSRRLLAALLLLVLVGSGAAFLVFANYGGIAYGGTTMGGETPLLLGYHHQQANSQSDALVYAYQPHGELRIQVGIANSGSLPVVFTGLASDDGWTQWFESSEIRLPPSPTFDQLPLYEPAGGGAWYSEPFRPIELPAHSGTTFMLILRFQDCSPFGSPMPTRIPGTPPAADYQPETGMVTFSTLPVGYTVAGLARTTAVALPEDIALAEPESGNGFGCPTPDFRRYLQSGFTLEPVTNPSGLFATPSVEIVPPGLTPQPTPQPTRQPTPLPTPAGS